MTESGALEKCAGLITRERSVFSRHAPMLARLREVLHARCMASTLFILHVQIR